MTTCCWHRFCMDFCRATILLIKTNSRFYGVVFSEVTFSDVSADPNYDFSQDINVLQNWPGAPNPGLATAHLHLLSRSMQPKLTDPRSPPFYTMVKTKSCRYKVLTLLTLGHPKAAANPASFNTRHSGHLVELFF